MSVSETLPTKIRKSPQRPITTKYEEFRFKKYTYRGNTYRRKAVLQFSKEGVLLAEFPSTHHASRATGILKTAIYNNTRGVTKTAGGFVWQV